MTGVWLILVTKFTRSNTNIQKILLHAWTNIFYKNILLLFHFETEMIKTRKWTGCHIYHVHVIRCTHGSRLSNVRPNKHFNENKNKETIPSVIILTL